MRDGDRRQSSAMRNSWQFTVAWGDLDANQHMRNTAYLDYAAPPEQLLAAMNRMPRSAEFTVLERGPAATA